MTEQLSPKPLAASAVWETAVTRNRRTAKTTSLALIFCTPPMVVMRFSMAAEAYRSPIRTTRATEVSSDLPGRRSRSFRAFRRHGELRDVPGVVLDHDG